MVSDMRSEPEWKETVEQMVSLGADGTAEQLEAVMRFLLRTLTNPHVLSGGSRELKVRSPSSWFIKAGSLLDRAAFRPATLPGDLVIGIALLPAIAAGLIIFKTPALEMLGIALAAGTAGVIAARWLWRDQRPHPGAGPLIAALFGVALVGAGAGLIVSAEVAVLAVVLEVLRARYMPAIRAQAGLLAYAAIAIATRGAPLTYFDPNGTANPRDPIDTWYQLFHQSAWTLDPIRLYVGNVAGPAFATSLVAVVIGVAWLAYSRRLSLVVLLGFLAGSLVAIYTFHWDPVFQLDSGPTWFIAGLVLADRRMLPESWALCQSRLPRRFPRSCFHDRRRATGRDGGARNRLLVGLGLDGAVQAHAPAPSAGG